MVAVLATAEAIIVVAVDTHARFGFAVERAQHHAVGRYRALRAVNQVGEINLGLDIRRVDRRRGRRRRSSGGGGGCRCARGQLNDDRRPRRNDDDGFRRNGALRLDWNDSRRGHRLYRRAVAGEFFPGDASPQLLPNLRSTRIGASSETASQPSCDRPARAAHAHRAIETVMHLSSRCPHERRRASMFCMTLLTEPTFKAGRVCAAQSLAVQDAGVAMRRRASSIRTGRHPWHTGAALPTNSSVGERRHRAR